MNPQAEDITLGELARRIEGISTDQREQFAGLRRDFGLDIDRVEKSIAALTFVNPDVYAADKRAAEIERGALEGRLKAVEDTLKWVSRTIAAAIITAVVAIILFAGRSGT